MKYNAFSILVVLVGIWLASACSPQAAQARESFETHAAAAGSEVIDQANLIDALRAQGAEVELGDPIEQAFFSVTGQILKVDGKDVQVFQYESAESMGIDAAQVAPDGGSIGTSMVTWVEAPHFFKSGRVLVLYVGEDQGVIGLLKGILGEQFAGR